MVDLFSRQAEVALKVNAQVWEAEGFQILFWSKSLKKVISFILVVDSQI